MWKKINSKTSKKKKKKKMSCKSVIQGTRCVTQGTHIGFLPAKDMQTPPLNFASISMEDVQCAETNEKSIF